MSSPSAVKRAHQRCVHRQRVASSTQLVGWAGTTLGLWPFERLVEPLKSGQYKLTIVGPSGALYSRAVDYPDFGAGVHHSDGGDICYAEEMAVLAYTGWDRPFVRDAVWFYRYGGMDDMCAHPELREKLAPKLIAVDGYITLLKPRHAGNYISAIPRYDGTFGYSVDYKHIDSDIINNASLDYFVEHIVE